MWGSQGSATFFLVTETASLPAPRSADLPPSWWAPALSLAERLAAPGLPGAPAEAAAGPAPWAVGDAEGFAQRLAHLGVDRATAAALAAEPAGRLAARAAKPDWARYAEAALAGASREPAEPVTREGEGPDVFAPVVRPLVAAATARLAESLPADAEPAVWREAFARRLTHQMVRQAARTLVHELDTARRAGRLAGAGPRERFDAFVAATGTRQGLGALFAARPVLARMLAQTALDATAATAELAARFAADREDLAAGLLDGRDPGPLTGVDLGLGDAHEGNRSVAVLHFADERLVYKPRPLGQHALLDGLVCWLNAKVPGLDLRTPRSLRREAYGWLEFVEHRWCRSVTETDAFYRRQGALLALLYAVDGADMHYENVIACGDQPVLVDAETLLHTGLAQSMTAGADPAADALRASVHRTCLLPHLLIGEHGALDISALGRSTDGTYPSEGLHWRDSGLDTMRAVRGPLLSPAAHNQPLPAGRLLEGADHRAALLEGFRAAYTALAADGHELLGENGPLMSGADRPARLVARATRLYATLLEESTHPSLLGDALAREGVFAVLWTESGHDEARRRLIEHETAALWRGDVPLFTHRPSGTAVRADDGTWLPGVLPVAGVASVREKIARMDEVDCHDQEWIIAATIAARGAGSPLDRPRSELAVEPVPAVAPDASRLLAAACGIADEIAARAVRDGGRTNWLGLERVSGPHWAVLPMGAGLAQGYCGVALFLAHADALAGAGRYAALAREAVRPLPVLLKALADDPELSAAAGPGAYDGLGGVVYAVLRAVGAAGPGAGRLPARRAHRPRTRRVRLIRSGVRRRHGRSPDRRRRRARGDRRPGGAAARGRPGGPAARRGVRPRKDPGVLGRRREGPPRRFRRRCRGHRLGPAAVRRPPPPSGRRAHGRRPGAAGHRAAGRRGGPRGRVLVPRALRGGGRRRPPAPRTRCARRGPAGGPRRAPRPQPGAGHARHAGSPGRTRRTG